MLHGSGILIYTLVMFIDFLGKYGQMICGVRVQNHNVLRVCQRLQAEDKTHQTIKEYARA